jgi:2-methylcitrate synthase/citrate synthase II
MKDETLAAGVSDSSFILPPSSFFIEELLVSTAELYSPGLEGVIAGETAISTVEGGLRYRGYPVGELAEKTSFEEVAYLLLHGELPTARELAEFQKRLAAARSIPEPLRNLLRALPRSTPPMDALRSAVSVLAHFDPETADNSHDANMRKAERLLGQIPVAVADQYHFAKGTAPVAPRPDLSHAANFLYMLRGSEPSPADVRAFDVSLILYAEHEFNASTFTARVVVSTEADLHAAIVAAIGALKGRLHGGANEKVMDLLRQAGGPETAEAWVRGALARKERIMGFGHRVYKHGDMRARILKEYARKAAEAAGETKWERTAAIIEEIMEREKNLLPNLDWPAGRLYHAMGLEVPLYTPIFVMSRIAGWSAHVIEQLDHNRLIRPRSRYTGPGVRSVKALAERK